MAFRNAPNKNCLPIIFPNKTLGHSNWWETRQKKKRNHHNTPRKDLRSFIIVVPSYYIFAAFLPNLPNHFCTNQAHFCISNLTDTSPADASSYLWFLRHYENISSLPMHYFQPYLKAVHVIRVIEQCCFNSTPDPFNGQRANFILKPPKVIESRIYVKNDLEHYWNTTDLSLWKQHSYLVISGLNLSAKQTGAKS